MRRQQQRQRRRWSRVGKVPPAGCCSSTTTTTTTDTIAITTATTTTTITSDTTTTATTAIANTNTNTNTDTRMARKCCVLSCGNDVQETRAKGLPFHKFPKDATLRTKWVANCGFAPNFQPSPAQIVCHRHFKRTDYEAVRGGSKFLLRKGTVPSIFDDYDNHPDPIRMPVKPTTPVSYAQEDLDLINSEILNLDRTVLPSMMPQMQSLKSNNNDNQCLNNKKPEMTTNEPLKTINPMEKGCKTLNAKEDTLISNEQEQRDANIQENRYPLTTSTNAMEAQAKCENSSKEISTKEDAVVVSSLEDKKAEVAKSKTVNRAGLKFFPGAKLEAKDFNEKWYSARVVETDWDEREVLIHFDKWSSRYDEWIPMDSSRLRVLQMQPSEEVWTLPPPEPKMREFSVGERILATWADGRKYPAKVNAVLGNDRYDVLFDDGYAKVVKASKMTKIAGTSAKPIEGEEGYIGSKQERRDKKRKHTVMELFNTHGRKRSKDAEKSAVKKEEVPNNTVTVDTKMESPTVAETPYDSGTELLQGFDNNMPKVKHVTKKGKKESQKVENDHEDDNSPEWVDGLPQGVESYIVDVSGPRRSFIIADKRLPPEWQKHFTQRKSGSSAGKWDVIFIHKSSGKKFRSKHDIRAFMESQGQSNFDPEMFDFCIHRRKSGRVQVKQKQVDAGTPEMPKKIKTLLPKTKVTPDVASPSVNAVGSPNGTFPASSNNDGAVFIGGLRVEMEDSAYKCPKEGCNKNFRKENLLQMHIKHYHPEYSKFLGSTPNVADLAYARTIGESLEDIIPKKSNYLEKISKFEKRKSNVQEKSAGAGTSQLAASSPQASVPLDMEDDAMELEKPDGRKCDIKDALSSTSNFSLEKDDDSEKKRENGCAMSPGTLFDMRSKEERTQVGIKTLLPVRPATNAETIRSKSLDETMQERGKGQRKRQLSEYSSDTSAKGKKRHVLGVQEITDDYGDLDDSAVDVEGPLVYRYSRRKSDATARSDDNSQSSQPIDSRFDKGENIPKGDGTKRDNVNDTEDGEGVMMMINGELVKVEQLRREEIINCTCGIMEEDGLMIQCDLCLCWQHGHCNAIEREKDVPEKYVCYICRYPYRQRPSKKYFHDQDWIKEGKLPSLTARSKNQMTLNRRSATLKRSYDLVSALLQIRQVLHSLRVKITVAQKKDHPKLYLWAKKWEKSEIPQPDTTPVPVMEIIKTLSDSDSNSNSLRRIEVPIESKVEDPDDKSIASDSELMKILEEDTNENGDQSKVSCKKEEDSIDGNDTQILLDALTKADGGSDESLCKQENGIKIENGGLQQSTGTTSEEDLPKKENVLVAETTLPPMQPFIPEPEAPIDPTECKMRLLEHIEHFQSHIDSRLTSIEAHVMALESMDPDDDAENPDVHPRTKQTVQMLIRDLNTVRKLAALC